MEEKKTLVLGASENPSRYSHLAVERLAAHNHPVIALGKKPGVIGNVPIITDKKPLENIDTVSIYLNSSHQPEYYNYILSLKPKRIIFNPGAENAELEESCRKKRHKTNGSLHLGPAQHKPVLSISPQFFVL